MFSMLFILFYKTKSNQNQNQNLCTFDITAVFLMKLLRPVKGIRIHRLIIIKNLKYFFSVNIREISDYLHIRKQSNSQLGILSVWNFFVFLVLL